jgi:hypothetical protein
MLFNNSDKKTFKLCEILDQTSLSQADIETQLMKLCNPKTMVISKQNKNPNFKNPNEEFKLNENFEFNNIRINLIPKKTAKSEMEGEGAAQSLQEAESEVEKLRILQIDSVIVRIMKARKLLGFTELVSEVIRQINMFKAQPLQIKKRIENLIEREFLARDETNHSRFKYLP